MRVRYSFGSRHTGHIANILKQRGKYPDVVRKVIDISDIILEVLDARFIEETRNFELENKIKDLGKKIIFVLNKCDLVDVSKLEKELDRKMYPYVFVSSKTGQGAKDLRNRIKIEAKRVEMEEKIRIQVGIIGYPNTGKSSLINLITRKGSAKISKQAGFTKGLQKIRLTDEIQILDTPGVIPDEKYSNSKEENLSFDAMVGARSFNDVKNPEDIVYFLMQKNSKKIEKFYEIDAKGDSQILIEELGKKKGFLKKAGETNIDRTARAILRDWQEGKIRK
ncbi:MAG: GTPase [Candidatus Pacearchaeota archaeon]